MIMLARTLGLIPWTLEIQGLKTEGYRDTRGPGRNAYGFGAGVGVGVFWNSIGIFSSPLFLEGVEDLWATIRTGSAPRPVLLLQLFAFGGHILIIVACLVGFFCTPPGTRQWGQFIAGGGLVIGYFVAIVFASGPLSAVALFRRVFGL
jgi:hypothetical protein